MKIILYNRNKSRQADNGKRQSGKKGKCKGSQTSSAECNEREE
jgi:hypothetical protein